MTEQENPDQPTLDLLRQAVELHCRKHVALGPEDAEEWFFELAHDVWKQCAAGQWSAYFRERKHRSMEARQPKRSRGQGLAARPTARGGAKRP